MPSLLKSLGISSPQEAAELEQDLGIRFKNFTPLQCETWRQQSVYLHLYAQTRTFTHAARAAGVTIRKARQWQSQNTLGFNQRLEIAVLEYTEEIEVLLLDRARQPDSPPTFLTMLLRAQMPEKYGPARRSSPPRDNHGDNDRGDDQDSEHTPAPSDNNQPSLADIQRQLEQLQHLTAKAPVGAGFKPAPDLSHTEGEDTTHPDLSPTTEETIHPDLSPTDRPSVEAGFKPAPVLSPTTEETTHPDLSPTDQAPVEAGFKPALVPSPTTEETQREGTPQLPAPTTRNLPGLTRRQRRELQRQAKRKRQKSHRPRAPN